MGGRGWKRGLRLLLLVAAGVAIGWWFAHPRTTEEELILEVVARAEHGVETKSVQEIMDCIAPDYEDEAGLTRVDVWRLAMRWARSPERADVVIEEYEVTVTPPTATGHFVGRVLVEQEGQYTAPLNLDVRVEFEKQRRRWRKVWLVKSVSEATAAQEYEGYL
jgi:hypothetical protein